MSRKRFLPAHVSRYQDRHGKWRYRYRRAGHAGGTFKAAFGTDAFQREYAAFESDARTIESPERYAPGSVGDLVARYFAMPERLGPTAITQAKIKATLEPFRTEFGHDRVRDFTFEHIDAIIARKRVKGSVKTRSGMRPTGGVHAARKLRKELVRLFDFAARLKLRSDNPVSVSERVREAPGKRSKGFVTWSEEDIAAYRARHALGTMARLALELLLWTAQRRSDANRMAPADIVDGRVEVEQDKTGKLLWIPVARQLLEAIDAVSAPEPGLPFIRTSRGGAYTKESFGNRFREWCDEAGLVRRSAHGLRKASMRRMAEIGITNQGMKAISGHSRDDEVARYTAAANQVSMADDAMTRLSDWELGQGVRLSNPPENEVSNPLLSTQK